MFYEEYTDAFYLTWFRTSPNGKWVLKIPESVNTDINKRWEHGVPHHPSSEALVKAMQCVDRRYCGGMFDIETGGDGDNGESLLYLLDIIFEVQFIPQQ